MFLLLLSSLSAASAAELSWGSFYGEERFVASSLSELPTDAEGTVHGGELSLDNRLRLGFTGAPQGLSLALEADFFSGLLLGSPYASEDERAREALSAEGFVPRRVSVRGQNGPLDLEAGLTTSQWGLGMLANNGAADPWFGRSDFGDRVLRMRATTRPFSGAPEVTLTGALDRVVADELALWSEDQTAIQGILALLYAEEDARLGLYTVYRYQREERYDRDTRVGVADLYADRTLSAGPGRLQLAAELAGFMGSTDRATTYASPDRVGVLAFGATALAHFQADPWGLALRGAYASADGDPDDGVAHDFTFDRDFDAGMVLFDEVMGAIEASTHALLSDPERAGQPPDGIEASVTEGAFKRSSFVQPILDFTPRPWVSLRGGVMFAFADGPATQPFYTYRAGGVPTNYLNEPVDSRSLGTEIDWALRVGHATAQEGLTPSLLLQGGHLLLGEALRSEDSAPLHLLLASARLRW